MDNKVRIHFDEDKTKSIFFASKFKRKNVKKLDITYGDSQIKQHLKVKYLGCLLDETMSGEAMAFNFINKSTKTLKFIHRKNSFFDTSTETPALKCINTDPF